MFWLYVGVVFAVVVAAAWWVGRRGSGTRSVSRRNGAVERDIARGQASAYGPGDGPGVGQDPAFRPPRDGSVGGV